jgi:hypothetical protein
MGLVPFKSPNVNFTRSTYQKPCYSKLKYIVSRSPGEPHIAPLVHALPCRLKRRAPPGVQLGAPVHPAPLEFLRSSLGAPPGSRFGVKLFQLREPFLAHRFIPPVSVVLTLVSRTGPMPWRPVRQNAKPSSERRARTRRIHAISPIAGARPRNNPTHLARLDWQSAPLLSSSLIRISGQR